MIKKNNKTRKIMGKKHKSFIVQQSNALIESSQTLTVVERRIIYHILSRLNPEKQKSSYEITIEDFYGDFPQMNKKRVYQQVKEGIEKLWRREIVFVDEQEKVTKIRWFSSQQYQDKQGYLKISFSNEVMPLIFDLKKKYTTMLLENFKTLDSVYSLRLYELLSQYQAIWQREITIENLRFFLDCVNSHKEFKFLKMRVIEPAVKEINAKTNFLITKVQYNKTGRKVTSVTFEFCDKERVELDNFGKTEEPKLERYPRIRKFDPHKPIIRNKIQLEDSKEVFDYIKNLHIGVFEIALKNLKMISDYEQEGNVKLSTRLKQAKIKAQSKIGTYYTSPELYNITIEELDDLKEKIISNTPLAMTIY